jgi:uncharacterized protein YndB with AHSA1/START domain
VRVYGRRPGLGLEASEPASRRVLADVTAGGPRARRIVLAAAAAGLGVVLAWAPLPLKDLTRIETTVLIRRSAPEVFEYVTTPANWPRWHPSSIAVSGATDHSLRVGEQATEDFLVAGRRGQARWSVTAREAPFKWSIEGSIQGRRAGVVTYTLTPRPQGTLFEREFTYGSPNLLFSLLNRLQIRRRVDAESREALRRLKQVLERP